MYFAELAVKPGRQRLAGLNSPLLQSCAPCSRACQFVQLPLHLNKIAASKEHMLRNVGDLCRRA